jgi:hypothetical protein
MKVDVLERDLYTRNQQFQMLQEKMVAMTTTPPTTPEKIPDPKAEQKDDSWFSAIACCGADRAMDPTSSSRNARDVPIAARST